MIKKVVVDCISGANILNNENNSNEYKTIEDALENMNSEDKMFINPGRYSGINLEASKNFFKSEIEGQGICSELYYISLSGELEIKFKSLKLNEVSLNINKSYVMYKNVDFHGNNKFTIEAGDKSEIEFVDCSFGVNYQLYLKSGRYSITFKNCTFRNSRTVPIIFCRTGTYLISAIMCIIKDVPFIHNKFADVSVRHSNCLIEFLSNMELEEISQQTNTTQNNLSFQRQNVYNSRNKKTNITCSVNSDIYSEIGLDKRTIFVRIYGSNSLIIKLPPIKLMKIGTIIEIVNECPSFIIEDRSFSGPYCKIILTDDGWYFYRYQV